jgi:mRNA interferase RelE/StbE
MTWNLIVAQPARKELNRLPPESRARILSALREMANDPHAGDIVRLKGTRFGWRRRVGDYRILYDLDPAERLITVQHRPSHHDHLPQALTPTPPPATLRRALVEHRNFDRFPCRLLLLDDRRALI